MTKPRIAIVTWLDTHSDDGWSEVPTEYAPLEVESIGYIYQFNDGVIVVPNMIAVQEYSAVPQQYGRSMIPRGCIRSIQFLEVQSK